MGFHADATTTELHVPAYVQDTDPGAVGAGIMWIDTSAGAGLWVSKLRNTGDTDWEEIGKTPGGGFPDIPHYSKGTGNFNVILRTAQTHIFDGQTIKISCFDLIQCMQGGAASPTYTYYIRTSAGSFGAGNSDPTAEYVSYTTAQNPAIIYVKVSDGTTTTNEALITAIVAWTA